MTNPTTIPVKFESLQTQTRNNVVPFLLRADEDLEVLENLVRRCRNQAAGMLSVPFGLPGVGKTTLAHTAPIFLPGIIADVFNVPGSLDLELRDLPAWLREHLPAESRGKQTLVVVDGREATDDLPGLRDVVSTINQIVRRRSDLLFFWPTTSLDWQQEIVGVAQKIAGGSLVPRSAQFEVAGLRRDRWVDAAELVLDQVGESWEELGINELHRTTLTDTAETVGDFLNELNEIRSQQEAVAEGLTGLPTLVFVVTSESHVVQVTSALRNPRTYKLRTDELLASSDGRAAKFWKARAGASRGSPAWVAANFRSRLVTSTPSAVAHACAKFAPNGSRLFDAMHEIEGFSGNLGTGRSAFLSTDLARFLEGKPVPQITRSEKGRTVDATLEAYRVVQAMSKHHHKSINHSILALAASGSSNLNFDPANLEVPVGADIQIDYLAREADHCIPDVDGDMALEFHHISGKSCKPSIISAYILEKLQYYAYAYRLMDR